MIKVAPSILSADFTILGSEVRECVSGGADYIHFDVMDGNFVPNLSIGIPVLKSLRKGTDGIIDAHLMIDKPVRYVENFCKSGADIVTIHVEADSVENNIEALKIIKACGKKTGASVKPGTPASALEPYYDLLDMVLVMTVEPGFGGQKFMADMLPKIEEIREVITSRNLKCDIEVDGGIDENTSSLVKKAGANVLVAGSAVFGKADRAEAIEKIRNA